MGQWSSCFQGSKEQPRQPGSSRRSSLSSQDSCSSSEILSFRKVDAPALLDLPIPVHELILKYIGSGDPVTRFRYAKTCRWLWDMTEKTKNNLTDYRIVIKRNKIILDHGPVEIYPLTNLRIQALLLWQTTVARIRIDELPSTLPIGLKTLELSVAGIREFDADNAKIHLLEILKPHSGKYQHVEFHDGDLEFLQYASENAESLMLYANLPPALWLEIRCPEFPIYTMRDQNEEIQPFLDQMVLEWQAGARDIRDVTIYFSGDGPPRDEEYQRQDGQRIQITYKSSPLTSSFSYYALQKVAE